MHSDPEYLLNCRLQAPHILPLLAGSRCVGDRRRATRGEPNLPFIACTVGEMRDGEPGRLSAAINETLLELPGHRPRTACVDARDLRGHIGDNLHADSATAEEIGRRYAGETQRMLREAAH